MTKMILGLVFALLLTQKGFGSAKEDQIEIGFSHRCMESLREVTNPSLFLDRGRLQKQIETDFLPSVARSWQRDMPEEFAAIFRDPIEGKEKIETLKILGFEFNGNKSTSPSYFEAINNYLQALQAQGLKIEDSILPALVMTKIDHHFQVHYYLMTPGIDPWPSEPGFEAGMAPQFNLPYEVILEAGKRGRFPFMAGTHDLFHFVTFLMHPDYMKSLRANIQKIGNPRPVKYMGFRLNYSLEWLSLGNPRLKEKIKSRLQLFNKYPHLSDKEARSFDFYLAAMEALTKKELREHAERLKLEFPGFLIDYGGAVTRSKEKEDFAGLRGGSNILDLLVAPKPTRTIDRIWRENSSLQVKTLTEILNLVDLSESELRDFLNNGFSWVLRPRYARLYKPNQDLEKRSNDPGHNLEPAEDVPEQIDQMLRLQLARMEYSLWRSVNGMTQAKFMDGLYQNGDGTVDSEVATFVKFSFGEESFFYSILRNHVKDNHSKSHQDTN